MFPTFSPSNDDTQEHFVWKMDHMYGRGEWGESNREEL